MPVVYLTRVVYHPHQLVDRTLHRTVVVVGHQLAQVQGRGSLDAVVQLLLGVLAVGKALNLEDYDLREAVEVYLAFALAES